MKKALKWAFNNIGYEVTKRSVTNKMDSVKGDNILTLHKTKTGDYYLPTDAKEDVIANEIINDCIFDVEIYNEAKKHIKKNTSVLDVGANFGQLTILFSELVENGNVYSFEADDFVFSVLEKNILENNRKNINSVFGAVHDKDNEILYFPKQDFERFKTYGSYGIDYINKKGREVKTVTIDSLKIGTPISFMKIDIQGGDLFALKGARETIRKNQMPIIFEYEYLFEDELGLNFQEYVDFVSDIGYKFQKVINGQNYLIVPKK